VADFTYVSTWQGFVYGVLPVSLLDFKQAA
jgi:hypothetical protein